MIGNEADLEFREYTIFGLYVRSRLELPELIAAAGTAVPDVQIDFGSVPQPPGAQEGLVRVGDALVLLVPDVARYRIQGGTTVIVDPLPGVPTSNIRLFLLGSAFGALLHQRGLLPLHANAVSVNGKIVAFMGASREGKSTLAAWFHDHGFRPIADDVAVVRFETGGRASVAPGQQRLRLWRETLEATGRDASAYARSFAGRDDLEKYDVPLDAPHARLDHDTLAAIYLLATADEFSIEPLVGLDAVDAIFSHTYRGHYVDDSGSREQHWKSAVALAQSTPIFRLARQRNLSLMDDNGRLILDHIAALDTIDPG